MRKCSIFAASILLLVACNNNQTSGSLESKPDSSAQATNYAYTTEHKPNWETGNPKNISIALNALKNFETNKLDALKESLTDSVSFYGDGVQFRGTKDSLIKLFQKDWDNFQSYSVQMEDWETVHGKDNNEDWVSMWYKEKWTEKNGKSDSVFSMDDLKIENGKISVIDSKRRKFPEKK